MTTTQHCLDCGARPGMCASCEGDGTICGLVDCAVCDGTGSCQSCKPNPVPDATTTLATALDASDEPWQLWRAAGGKWIIQRGEGHSDPSSRTLEGATIHEVLQLAVDSKRLPTVPRKPRLRHYSFEKRGTGARSWKVLCDGHPILHLGLKRDAKTAVDRLSSEQIKARDNWVNKHLLFIETHRENVDFYWIDG